MPVEINYDELKNDCQLKNTRINRFWEAVSFCLVYIFQKRKNIVDISEMVNVEEMK